MTDPSGGIRRVRRDVHTKPKLNMSSSSKVSPRLFTSPLNRSSRSRSRRNHREMYDNDNASNESMSAKNHHLYLLTSRGANITKKQNDSIQTIEEGETDKKPKQKSFLQKDVTLEVIDDFEDANKASDVMSLQSSPYLMLAKHRRSINEIRNQQKLTVLGKAMFLMTLMTFALTKSIELFKRTPSEASFRGASIVFEELKDVESKKDENDKSLYDKEQYEKEEEKEKHPGLAWAETLLENIINEEESEKEERENRINQFDFFATPKDSTITSSSEYDSSTTTSSYTLTSSKPKDKSKLYSVSSKNIPVSTTGKKIELGSPKLSGGIENSFSVKSLTDLPEALGNFADFTSKVDLDEDVPFFWDIHLAGGTVVEHVFGSCLSLLQASEIGNQHDIDDATFDESLQIVEIEGEQYLNIDTTTETGLAHAKSLDIMASPLSPSVIYSPLVHEMSTIFTPTNRGRMFALFRNPMERAVSMYYYLQRATWDPLYHPQLGKLSIEEYALSSMVENNWMTRFLLNKKGGTLSYSDLLMAKEIIRRKCLVGLFEKMEESMVRFEMYFGWRDQMDSKKKKCEKKLIKKGDDRHNHPMLQKGTKAWEALYQQNKFDVELYEYAKQVFKEQGEIKQMQ